MENVYKLYNGKNADILEIVSWINFTIGFDKSTMEFTKPDLFTLLENINSYEFIEFDDIVCILNCLKDAFVHIQNNTHYNILRKHEIMHISKANEFDEKSIEWLAKQNGISIRHKLSNTNNQILAVRREYNLDTYENRVVKSVILMLRPLFDNPYFTNINGYEPLFKKMLKFVRDDLADVNHLGGIVVNNILLYDKHYSKFYKAQKWLGKLRAKTADLNKFRQDILDKKNNICKFIALANLHKFTREPIKPSAISTKQEKYRIKFNDDFLIENEITKFIENDNNLNLKEISRNNLNFIKHKTEIIEPPLDPLKSKRNELVFVDIFRLYPLIHIREKTYQMPLLLRQKIDGENINANHSKIIIDDTEFDTMYNVLLNKNNELSIFLRDIKRTIGESEEFYYIVPDYINMFDFNETHKTIRSYFAKANFLYKSIVIASEFILQKKASSNDTLLFIQENEKGQVFVTPILVTYNEKNKDGVTNGLCLVKYPTKYMKNTKGLSEKPQDIQNKFGKIGINELEYNNIKFYRDNKLYQMHTMQMEYDCNIEEIEIKNKYIKFERLFKGKIIKFYDEIKPNLENFQILINEKLKGNILYTEHLPNLEIIIEDDIEEKSFSLVSENSELDYKNEIMVKNHFEIPDGEKEVRAPLILDDGKIEYHMLLESKQMPFNESLECSLTLEYNYEAENIYTLVFTPIDTNYQPMIAKWVKGKQKHRDMSKIYPSFIPKTTIDELKKYPKKDKSGTSNLFEQVETTLKSMMNSNRIDGQVYSIKNDYCFVRDDEGDEILCHKNQFVSEDEWHALKNGAILYFKKTKTPRGYKASDISYKKVHINTNEYFIKNIKPLRFHMIKIFDGHSLLDDDIPVSFRNIISEFIEFYNSFLVNFREEPNDELIMFFSCLHESSNLGKFLFENYVRLSKKSNGKLALARSIGSCSQEWQKEIFKKAIKKSEIKILSICLWRNEDLVFKINKEQANKIIYSITEKLNNSNLEISIEVLLAILRLRSVGYDILNPSDDKTQELLEKLRGLEKYKNRQELRSYLRLEVEKPKEYNEMDDLIYALFSFIKGKNTNSIKIIGTNDDES